MGSKDTGKPIDEEDGSEMEKPPKEGAGKTKYRHISKLLSLAAEGKRKKIVKHLRKHPYLDINSFDSEGLTALHQASRFGHYKAVQLLLQSGANSKAEDFNGNTPAHLAAAKRDFAVLAVFLKDKSQLEILDSEDEASLRGHLQAAMEGSEEPQPAAPPFSSSSRGLSPSYPASDAEEDWDEKLRMNSNYDDPFQDNMLGSGFSEWDSWEYESFVEPGYDPEDEEAYARKMWENMQRQNHAPKQAGPATAETWARADSAQKRRQRAAEDAAEHSKKILEEEQAKDRAWRQAVLQGDQGARRAAYEAKWQTLASMAGPIMYNDIPWVSVDETTASAMILYGVQGAAERRKRLRLELMRWHPDKFVAKFGSRVVPADRERIAEGVKRVSQMLNSLGSTSSS